MPMVTMVNEETRLAAVKTLILAQINELTADLKIKHGSIAEARQDMWAETHIIRDFDDVAELSTLLSEVVIKERQYSNVRQRLLNLQRMLDAPYFGRIDFVEDGYNDTEKIYVGGQGLFDDKALQYMVYDWRAPISSMYYDYGLGRADFAAPDGTVSGEITLKRQYRIEKGQLVYAFDSDLIIEDDILQQELSKASDAKIKTIITSIQREQNLAIRAEDDHVLVFGPAGSGKTSVGLHRLAYLLYRHRGRLTSSKTRVFSANNIFSSYISGIIPALGEEDVLTLDFKALITEYANKEYIFYDSYEQIDYLTQNEDGNAPRRKGILLKHDPVFTAFIMEFIKRYSPSVNEDVYFNNDLICGRERIADLYVDRTHAGNLASKTSRALDYVSRCYDEYFKANKQQITDFFNDLYDDNFSDGEIRGKFDEQKNIVLADLRGRFFPGAKKLYERILRAYAKQEPHYADVIRHTAAALRQEKLFYEDTIALFFIDIITGRIKKERNVRHILVDESQDMSAVHHHILRGLFENCHFTVLADINQALYPEINLSSMESLTDIYRGASVISLNKSYRSTFEISRFAANLLGDFDESRHYRRMGGEPGVIDTGNVMEAVLDILADLPGTYNTVGILLTGTRQAEVFYKKAALLKPGAARLIAGGDDEFGPGVMVMAVQYAKGLEFDAVIVPEYGSDVFNNGKGRRMLYLMCTRALHRLTLVKGPV